MSIVVRQIKLDLAGTACPPPLGVTKRGSPQSRHGGHTHELGTNPGLGAPDQEIIFSAGGAVFLSSGGKLLALLKVTLMTSQLDPT